MKINYCCLYIFTKCINFYYMFHCFQMWRNLFKKKPKRSKNESSVSKTEIESFSIIDWLINNPGLIHVAEQIFGYLNNETLLSCLLVSNPWNTYLNNESRILSWRKLEWLHNKKIDAAPKGSRYRKAHSILSLFPDWINVLNYFKRKGSLEDLKEIVTVLELYVTKYEATSGLYISSPLLAASTWNHHKFLEILFKSKIEIDFNPKSRVQDSGLEPITRPIEEALFETSGNVKTLKVFLDYSNLISTVPIQYICSFAHINIVKLLLSQENEKSIDFKALDADGLSVLHWACFSDFGSIEVLELLLDQSEELGLDVNLIGDYSRKVRLSLQHISGDGSYDWKEYAKTMLTDCGKGTPLHAACWNGRRDALNVFLDRAEKLGINVAAMDSHGRTVLHIAASSWNSMYLMDILLPRAREFGIDLNHKDWKGHNFFQSACLAHLKLSLSVGWQENIDGWVEYLLQEAEKFDFEINPKDENGKSWLEIVEEGDGILHALVNAKERKKIASLIEQALIKDESESVDTE